VVCGPWSRSPVVFIRVIRVIRGASGPGRCFQSRFVAVYSIPGLDGVSPYRLCTVAAPRQLSLLISDLCFLVRGPYPRNPRNPRFLLSGAVFPVAVSGGVLNSGARRSLALPGSTAATPRQLSLPASDV
jgi:hypothetical protein